MRPAPAPARRPRLPGNAGCPPPPKVPPARRHSTSRSGRSETMKPWISTRLPTTKPRLGPGGGVSSLYCDTMPHIATRANGIQQVEHRRLHRAADILEIRVDPLGTGGGEFAFQVQRAMIDAVVKAERVLHPQALFRPAGDAHHAGAGTLRQLPRDGTHRAGGGGHHHGLARLRLADLADAGIGGGARHSQHTKIGGQWRATAGQFHQPLAGGDQMRGPAARARPRYHRGRSRDARRRAPHPRFPRSSSHRSAPRPHRSAVRATGRACRDRWTRRWCGSAPRRGRAAGWVPRAARSRGGWVRRRGAASAPRSGGSSRLGSWLAPVVWRG